MNQYFEQMILTASPVELTRLLYQKAISSVREAREHLRNRRIMERGRSINNAWLILVELNTSLNKDEAPELSSRLSSLYLYMQSKLLEANFKQRDEPLAEVLSLLSTLNEAWTSIPDVTEVPDIPAPRNPWAGVAQTDDEPARLALSA